MVAGVWETASPHVLMVQSETDPATLYYVNVADLTCTCPKFTKTHRPCKHLAKISTDNLHLLKWKKV